MADLMEWRKKLDLCGRCGNCQQVCPLYQEYKNEVVVARGKLHLLSLLLDKKIEPTSRLKEIMDLCLLCGRCADLCQNGVPADTIIAMGRAELNSRLGKGLKGTLTTILLGKDKLDPALKALSVLEGAGLKSTLKLAGTIHPSWSHYEGILPPVQFSPLKQKLPAAVSGKPSKPKVGYFIGCVNNHVSHKTAEASLTILKAMGFTVIIPEQKCCGMPAWANGDHETAKKLVQYNMDSFNIADVDFIVTDCASCGHALKELPSLFWGEEGREFQEKVLDFSEFLNRFSEDIRLSGLGKKVTFHDPCHLQQGQKVREEPRRLINMIPDVEFIELENPGCCGYSGTFILSHYDASNSLALQRASSIKESGADIVVTSCPACQMQLKRVCGEDGQNVEVLNLTELLERVLLKEKDQ